MPRRHRNPPMPRPKRFPRFGAPNMNGMVKTVGNTAMGVVGIGAISALSLGALNAIKPK